MTGAVACGTGETTNQQRSLVIISEQNAGRNGSGGRRYHVGTVPTYIGAPRSPLS